MQAQSHPLEPFFQQAVRNSYEGKLGLNDPDVTAYVARLLCEFSAADNLYKVRDEAGRPIEELSEMVEASDPVRGSATSFDAERALLLHPSPHSDEPRQHRRHRVRHAPVIADFNEVRATLRIRVHHLVQQQAQQR